MVVFLVAGSLKRGVRQGCVQMTLIRLDWKFALTSLLAIIGVLVPVFIWNADFTAQSLTVRLFSSSALELPADSKIHDLQILVNGSKIESPHIYSLAIINSGSKPIPSASFETPLEVRTLNDSKLITAQMIGSEPADIPAKILIEDNKLKILPFLSNSQDQINITVVSSGPLDLAVQARIAGVRDVVYEDTTQTTAQPISAFFNAFLGIACLALYLFYLPVGKARTPARIALTLKILTTSALVLAGISFSTRSLNVLSLSGATFTGLLLVMNVIAWLIADVLLRVNRQAVQNYDSSEDRS